MPTCIAYTEAGAICRRPAMVLNVRRGGMVCDAHARHDRPEPRTEA
jgi:hypothetical protein